MNESETDLIRRGMRTPRAAALAGILFSFLLMGSMLETAAASTKE
jgi:hypothetical protein